MAADDLDFSGRSGPRVRGWSALAAIVGTLALAGLILLVAAALRDRDAAVKAERHAYDVTLLTRSIDAATARAEAALGRFVLDEQVQQSGALYAQEWARAARGIEALRRLTAADAAQQRRIADLERLFNRRAAELNRAAVAAQRRAGTTGITLYFQSGGSPTGPALARALAAIAEAEQEALQRRMTDVAVQTQETEQLVAWLSTAAVLLGLGAIGIAFLAVQAARAGDRARADADDEAARAAQLEAAVAERTQELTAANAALLAEAETREAAEAQLRQLQKMEAVGQLTGGIAHDFNNMLAVVIGGIDLARRRLTGPQPEADAFLEQALDGANRAAELTRRLLSFARVDPVAATSLSLPQLGAELRPLIDRAIGERVTVTIDMPDTLWPVRADRSQLENALLNLVVNARDAMDGAGHVRIDAANETLAATETLAAGDYVRLSVHDEGHGMSPEVIERALEPFFTTKEVGKGTGLGLSQIFGFVRQSGGDIRIDSVVGEGTVVSLVLPRGTEDVAAAPLPATATIAASGEAAILLVEDDPRVRDAAIAALGELGYAVTASPGGDDALDAFAARRFDLVISDVIMPGRTGPELVAAMRAMRPDVAVLFVTGYYGEEEGRAIAGEHLLKKPFTVAALSQAVAAALAQPRAAA